MLPHLRVRLQCPALHANALGQWWQEPLRTILSTICCSDDGSIEDRLFCDSAVLLPRIYVKLHAVSR